MTTRLPIRIVAIGCGNRSHAYCSIAAKHPERYQIVAGADPIPDRVAAVSRHAAASFRGFDSADACFAAGKLGDLAIIGTQDAYHVEPCLKALGLGYDVLLEKPAGPNLADIARIRDAADRLGRRVLVCHVLRYSPIWSTVHRLVSSGRIGRLIHIDHREGVGAFHQSHSFVRGHWANSKTSNPMILAKCCHDMDLIRWFMDRAPQRIASFGTLTYFRPENKPAGAADRCQRCPIRATCDYDCAHYAGRQRGWLWSISLDLAARGTPEEIRAFVENTPWGRCVWACDNDAADHQSVSMDFGDATASLTMTAFDVGRTMTLCGTRGRIRVFDGLGKDVRHNNTIELLDHHGGVEDVPIPGAHDALGHSSADARMIEHLADELAIADPRQMRTGIHASVDSHAMAFAAESSRLTGELARL